MKREKKYYNLCVKVMAYDMESESYELWFIRTFSSKKNYQIWRDGFYKGLDQTEVPYKVKLGEPYVKYFTFKPDF